VSWFHEHVDRAAPLIGLRDSPYEEFILVCLAGGAFSLFTRRRAEWFLVAAVIVLTIGVSAFLGGPLTRYALPIKPLLLLQAALILTSTARFGATLLGRVRLGFRARRDPDFRVTEG
jgi:hypothetical protein